MYKIINQLKLTTKNCERNLRKSTIFQEKNL